MPIKNTEKTIEKITYQSSNQAISYRELYNYKDFKIKLEIRSDSFQQQCFARASVLSNLDWNVIYTIPYTEMNLMKGLIYTVQYRNNVSAAEKEFKTDADRLKKYVRELL